MDDDVARFLRAESTIAGAMLGMAMMTPVYAAIAILALLTQVSRSAVHATPARFDEAMRTTDWP
jgi:uncharacterized membrane protein